MPDKKPLRVLFLLEDLCYGGTQKQNLELARRLDSKIFQPAILTFTGPTDLDAKAREASVPLFHMGKNRKAPPLFFARLGSHLARHKPDILVPCTALPNIWGRIWGHIARIPLIVGTCRGGGAPRRQHEWLLWRLAHGIVCNSEPLVKSMHASGAPLDRLRYIANGVDTEHFQPGGKKAAYPLLVCVARLAADKDHRTLLRAFAIAARKFPAARLRLVGEGPEEAALRQFAALELPPGIASRVEFAGASADPAPHLAEAHVFALASAREGQPNAILEAMACGLPICATNVGGIPNLVNGNGLLCEPSSPEALAASLAVLLENAPLAASMGQKGRNRCQRDFSFASMVAKHQDFFLELWQKYGAEKK